ncbi:DNA polymerase II large subunit [Candidatus Marsarchaeota archaeon]|nr:DNA polymerase II large subunit [Candidatus Marsarchaeota archaeon]
MNIEEYFKHLRDGAAKAYKVAEAARAKGMDPTEFVEIKPAPDLPSRVEGIIGVEGMADLIRKKMDGKSRQELAFSIVNEICTSSKFEMDTKARITLAVKVGLSILTEGILVAPTEGLPGVEIYKNPDGTEYLSIVYAGPIRAAGGTCEALSVALGDYARKLLGLDQYKPQKTEVERGIEEIMLYHTRSGKHLQYLPSEHDIRVILENSPICIDGVPTEEIEVSVHRDIRKIDKKGAEIIMTNRVRGGVALVVCEGIAQKAKSVLKYAKHAGLDWSWLNEIIKVNKASFLISAEESHDPAFLKELIGGRPVIAYPDHPGAFRLRYGRSRFTGIAAKGFSPATMILLDDFIAIGTQVKIEKPGKGSIAMPVDSIEGPFVKLTSGEALRIDTAEQARRMKDKVAKIISVGDMLVSYGDFKKTSTPMVQPSYVEEFWSAQLARNGYASQITEIGSFEAAYRISMQYGVPLHPKYLYEYQDISVQELGTLAKSMIGAQIKTKGNNVFDIEEIIFDEKTAQIVRPIIETLCIPHHDNGELRIKSDWAQSLVASLGFIEKEQLNINESALSRYTGEDMFAVLNSTAPFKIMRRSSRIGARIGRPEKARERMMKPAPNGMFPIGNAGGKERNIMKAYFIAKKQFGKPTIEMDIANYRCTKGGEQLDSIYCYTHSARAQVETMCSNCGRKTKGDKCTFCGGNSVASRVRGVDIVKYIESSAARLGVVMPKLVKGVKGLTSKEKIAEPIEKCILRSAFNIYAFKDGTTRFDATDAPITHFYPKEISVGIDRLMQLGYDKDALGEKLERADQLVELKHQDLIINRRGAEYLLKVSKFVDALLSRHYGIDTFYNASSIDDLIGQFVITLSPHTSAGALGRIIGFTDANVGLAHPYTIAARRRNCDGDEDTTMLLLDALINFSRKYLPNMIGGTMDAPLILTENVLPEEVDDEAWQMEVVSEYGVDFYDKAMAQANPSEITVETVDSRLNKSTIYDNLMFTHQSSINAMTDAPNKSVYIKLKTMDEKIEMQFSLMDKLCSIDRRDTARRLISGHFLRDLMGNLHSFSQQGFRCVACNAKYRRVPLVGKCTRCGGKIILTISRGGIEKYLKMATDLADRYELEPYTKQRIYLIKKEIEAVFGGTIESGSKTKQFNLSKFM